MASNTEYTFSKAYSKRGVVNELIGSVNTATAETSLGNITGNAFTNLTVALKGTINDQYLAGGGIVGVRAAGEGTSSPVLAGNLQHSTTD